MRCIVLRPLCALAVVAATFLLSNSSFAAILGGTVVGSSQPGVFELLPTPPATAGPNSFDSINLIGFNERQKCRAQHSASSGWSDLAGRRGRFQPITSFSTHPAGLG